MSTQSPTPCKRSDPRGCYQVLGTDAEGATHVHRTTDNTDHVITTEGDRELVQSLNGRPVSEWMTYVDGKRGWRTRHLYNSLGDAFADALGVAE